MLLHGFESEGAFESGGARQPNALTSKSEAPEALCLEVLMVFATRVLMYECLVLRSRSWYVALDARARIVLMLNVALIFFK